MSLFATCMSIMSCRGKQPTQMGSRCWSGNGGAWEPKKQKGGYEHGLFASTLPNMTFQAVNQPGTLQSPSVAMATGLTTVFTPVSACISTYIFDRWSSDYEFNESTTSVTYVDGFFRFRSTALSDGKTFPCTPHGGMLSGTPSFSPGLSCPLNWAISTTLHVGERTTGFCCPMYETLTVWIKSRY